MKKFIYILFTLLIITNKMMAEELFPNILYSNCSSSIEKIVINEFTNIDSLVREYNNKIPKLDVTLSFYNTDTKIIDSTISLLKVHRLILDISFHNCTFKILPYSIRKLSSLTGLHFNSCDSLVSLNGFNTTNTLFLVTLESCRIKELPEGLDKIYSFLFLMLDFPNDFTGFDLNKELDKFSERKNILNLFVKYKQLDKFPESLFKLTNLQSLMFFTDSSVYFPPRFNELTNLLEIRTSNNSQKVIESFDKGERHIFGCFGDNNFFNEEIDEIEHETGKYCLISGQRTQFRYKVEIDTNTIQGFAFTYIKDNAYVVKRQQLTRLFYQLNLVDSLIRTKYIKNC